MTDVDQGPTLEDDARIDFDHSSHELSTHLHETLREQRETCPVMHGSRYGGFWALTRYEDVAAAAKDHTRFSTASGVTIPPFGSPVAAIPLELDPPEHTAFRKILQPHFTPAAARALEPSIRQLVRSIVDEFADDGHADMVHALGAPIPPLVIAMVLGLDESDWPRLRSWTSQMIEASVAEDRDANRAAAGQLFAFLRESIADRQANPRDDLLTEIVHGTVDGRPLSDDELLGMVQLISVAGHETTVNGIGNLLHHLVLHPEVRERLVADPSLIPAAVDESLRFEAPVLCLARTVVADTEMSGTQLSTGDKVLLLWGSANRDGERFAEPDRFDIDRTDNRSLTFGLGAHRCLGEHLAKVEICVTVEELLRRVPEFHLAEGAVVGSHVGNNRGPLTLPLEW